MCLALAGPGLAGIATSPPDAAVDDAYSTDEDVVLTVDLPGVMANDAAPELACVAATDTSGLAGAVTLASDGSFSFTPHGNANGPTSFAYGLMLTGAEGCPGPYDDTATVTITIDPVNDPPAAAGDSFQFVWQQTLNIPGPGVLANDADPDGDELTAVVEASPLRGVLTLAANGGFSYTPAAAPCPGLPDAFSYRASDGDATSPPRAVILTPAALPCPTPFVSASPAPAETPAATQTPEASPDASPETSPSAEPTASAGPTAFPATAAPSPGATAAPGPVDQEGGAPGLPVVLVGVLFVVLLMFGGAFAIPRWLEARGGAGADDLDDGFDGGAR